MQMGKVFLKCLFSAAIGTAIAFMLFSANSADTNAKEIVRALSEAAPDTEKNVRRADAATESLFEYVLQGAYLADNECEYTFGSDGFFAKESDGSRTTGEYFVTKNRDGYTVTVETDGKVTDVYGAQVCEKGEVKLQSAGEIITLKYKN